jgi:hypothetical protein
VQARALHLAWRASKPSQHSFSLCQPAWPLAGQPAHLDCSWGAGVTAAGEFKAGVAPAPLTAADLLARSVASVSSVSSVAGSLDEADAGGAEAGVTYSLFAYPAEDNFVRAVGWRVGLGCCCAHVRVTV